MRVCIRACFIELFYPRDFSRIGSLFDNKFFELALRYLIKLVFISRDSYIAEIRKF